MGLAGFGAKRITSSRFQLPPTPTVARVNVPNQSAVEVETLEEAVLKEGHRPAVR